MRVIFLERRFFIREVLLLVVVVLFLLERKNELSLLVLHESSLNDVLDDARGTVAWSE